MGYKAPHSAYFETTIYSEIFSLRCLLFLNACVFGAAIHHRLVAFMANVFFSEGLRLLNNVAGVVSIIALPTGSFSDCLVIDRCTTALFCLCGQLGSLGMVAVNRGRWNHRNVASLRESVEGDLLTCLRHLFQNTISRTTPPPPQADSGIA